ncbi:MAG: acyl-[acyl-carrier-protein] thioesterase [Acetanaerobacterium sp.]
MQAFSTEFIVEYPDCDVNNRFRLSNVMRKVQQIGGAHLDSLGFTYQRMMEDGVVLLLAKEGLTIRRLPMGGERIRLETSPRKPRGATLLRDCTFYAEDGEELIFAETTWVAADTATHRIVRPKDLRYDFLEALEEREYAVTSLRVKEPGDTREVGTRTIRFSDIDCNRHLNNAVYADIVYDYLPVEIAAEHMPKTFFVHFQHEASLGETLSVRRGRETGPEMSAEQTFVFSGCKPNGDCCFMAYIRF